MFFLLGIGEGLSQILPKVAPLLVRVGLGGRRRRRSTSWHRSFVPCSFGFV
jgi:hypothetical protein